MQDHLMKHLRGECTGVRRKQDGSAEEAEWMMMSRHMDIEEVDAIRPAFGPVRRFLGLAGPGG
jgi:hypothetical protein